MSADRAACVAQLVTLVGAISTFEAVYNGSPLTTAESSILSPIAIVAADGTADGPEVTMLGTNDEHYILIDLLLLRNPTAEADLSTLSKTVRDVIRANRAANGTWSSLELNGRSQLDYVIFNGEDYRLERIPVVVW